MKARERGAKVKSFQRSSDPEAREAARFLGLFGFLDTFGYTAKSSAARLGGAVTAGITTSIRMPEEVRELYETLAQATGRAKNELMVEALRSEGQRRLAELALVLEGREQARAGQLSPLGDVVSRFRARGMLPTDFAVESSDHSSETG